MIQDSQETPVVQEPIRYQIFGCLPNAGSIMPCAHTAVAHATRKHTWHDCPMQFGDIEHNFNMMWCCALNDRKANGYTHFAMVHSDIGTGPFWLDTLIEEMDRVDADVMTAVNAIK